ncbi:hypothetical protein AB8615_05015 [Litorimonas sp. RW-G-Af-16]|uniref:hypothetical protein n=1 Tax=Litorimonas sp. RW-G-Af-16 TaxID=3241168 RepID=UPI003AB0C6A7
MSDITKKIFSIEPDIADVVQNIDAEPVKHVEAPIVRPSATPPKADPVPEFITRDRPMFAKTTTVPDEPATAWIMWTGILLTFVWIAAVATYVFGVAGLGSSMEPMALTGLIMAVLLPAILITLLWMSWRRLAQMTFEAQRIAIVAETLTRADDVALGTTQNLANGIRAELAEVDKRLAKTVDDFSTLQVNISAEKRAIDEAGLSLSERAEDVGRNLTLQRQALESISGTFDSKMETLTAAIERQSQSLTDATQQANTNIGTATEKLAKTTGVVIEAGSALESKLSGASETIASSEAQISMLNTKLAEMIARLQEEQTKIQSELTLQVREINEASETATQSAELLMSSLRSGQDTVSALNTASLTTNETINQQFSDMGDKIAEAQVKANDISDKAATRVQESLAETRKDLAKLETDMLALQAKLRNARTKSEELDLGLPPQPQQPDAGNGRLRITPLETDFPPVEPPRIVPELRGPQTVDMLDPDMIVELPDEIPTDGPLNLGADMLIASADDEITSFEPDVLRRPAPVAKGFGRSKNKDKGGWRWRDMLGGLERPDPDPNSEQSASDIVKPLFGEPLSAPEPAPAEPAVNGGDIVATLCQLQLAPSAIVDDGTIIEASNAFVNHGVEAMQANVAKRLQSPAEHLRHELRANPSMLQAFQDFTSQYADKLSDLPPLPANLRAELGTAHGRAFLICAAAFS